MRSAVRKMAIVSAAIAGMAASVTNAWSEEAVDLGAGLKPKAGAPFTKPDQFRKAPPWRIGFSMPGVGNTWIVQLIEETKYEVSKHKEIAEAVVLDAQWNPAKQVADLEDLLTKNVDAIIVGPVTPTAVSAEIDKIAARGIPVIVAGTTADTDKYTTRLVQGGFDYGRAGGEFLVKELHGKGNVWMFRGLAGNSEDENRYQGAVSAFKGTNIKITAEVYGDWAYAKGKQLCENLVLSGKPVDGIWFSGAEMTRACIEVFKEAGKPLVPMTGEGNNGFFRTWHDTGVKSIAAVFPATLGEAEVKAAVALLEGKPLAKDYESRQVPITAGERDQYYRPDLNDNFWFPSGLPESRIQELYKKK